MICSVSTLIEVFPAFDTARHRAFLACGLLLAGLAVSIPARAAELEHVTIDIDRLREQVTERYRERVREKVASETRARIRNQVADSVEETLLDQIEDVIADTAEDALPAGVVETPTPEVVTGQLPSARIRTPTPDVTDRLLEARLMQISRDVDRAVDSVVDREANAALQDEWLVMTDEETLASLSSRGYRITKVEPLAGLGYLLGTISAPTTFKPGGKLFPELQVIESSQLAVDMNHVYFPQDENLPLPATSGAATFTSQSLADQQPGPTRIGMIDSSIDQQHPAFSETKITERPFTPAGFGKAMEHGTAVASLMVGHTDGFAGLSPGSELFSGVIFARDGKGRVFSTTAAIVKALNWMAEQNIHLVNMSIAGPDNAILAKAVARACEQGVTLVTAAGNAGPASPPLYPAGYACTIAVTAVDSNNRVYYRANRGDHIDFALPGVDVLHAVPGGGYARSSGTSYAAAVMSGLIAASIPETLTSVAEIRRRFAADAVDFGKAGIDPVFGMGVLRSRTASHISASAEPGSAHSLLNSD